MHGSCFDWVDYHSRRRPDDVALANADSPFALTWAQLEGRVSRLAHLLAGSGPVRRGDRVALLAENDLRFFEVQFACIRLGAAFVPLNIRLSPAELQVMLGDAGPRLLIHDTRFADVAAQVSEPAGLARFKIPHHLRVVDRLPRSATDKVARGELRNSFADANR